MANIYTVVLDPSEVAINRTQLDLNDQDTGFKIGGSGGGNGIDWGQAAINEYLAEEGQWGSSVVDFTVPNRQITINLLLGADQTGLEEVARLQLQQKVARFQAEGGWLKRQRYNGPPMYADIVNASITIPDNWGETGGVEPSVALVLEALPDFYGDEITLDAIPASGAGASVLKLSGSQANVEGDYPARARIVLTERSGNNQNAAVWGLRSRHYDSATTAKLLYEAEAMTALNGAAVTAESGASAGDVVLISNLPVGSWVPMLTTKLLSGGAALTHIGTYRVWARCYSSNGTPQVRVLWGVGSLSVPVSNDPTTLPAPVGSFYLLDLGVVRLDAPPVGTSEWTGVVQVMAGAAGHDFAVDCLYLQPLDETAGKLAYVDAPPASSIQAFEFGTAGADDSSNGGTVAWSNPGAIAVTGGTAEIALTAGEISHYLDATGFGFSIPSGATILGIVVDIGRWSGLIRGIADEAVQLIKGGVVQATNRSVGADWSAVPGDSYFGGTTDLWGTTWTPAQINASNFGVALAAQGFNFSGSDGFIKYVAVYVYYELASGFTVVQDAVVYADQIAELRTDGMFREGAGSSQYGPISQVGDLPRIPPSGLESRAAELFVKPSRGDLESLPDGGLDAFTAQVIYRPCWLSRP